MKLRFDLLDVLTDQDIMEEVLASNHRYKAEPLFSKTGVGSLKSATIEERASDMARSEALIRRLQERVNARSKNCEEKSASSEKT